MRAIFKNLSRSTVVGLLALVGLIVGASLVEYYGTLADAYNPNWEIQDANEFGEFLGYLLTITGAALFLLAIAVRARECSSPVATPQLS